MGTYVRTRVKVAGRGPTTVPRAGPVDAREESAWSNLFSLSVLLGMLPVVSASGLQAARVALRGVSPSGAGPLASNAVLSAKC